MEAITDLVVEVGLKTWIARLRTDHVAIFPTSGSKTSNAVAAEISEVTVLAVAAVTASVAADSAAVIALAVEVALAEAASADLAVAEGVADGKNLGLEFASNFQYNQNLANLQSI